MRKALYLALVPLFLFAALSADEAAARGQAAKELVRQFKLRTYTATRKDQDFYELLEGYVVKTRYCYVYGYSTSVVLTEGKIIFVDEDDVCDIEGIYRK